MGQLDGSADGRGCAKTITLAKTLSVAADDDNFIVTSSAASQALYNVSVHQRPLTRAHCGRLVQRTLGRPQI
jgi:hypothetical protein